MENTMIPSLALHLELDRQRNSPLFRQLYAGLRAAILTGHLEGGTRLPPTRQLAHELEVSRKTVVNAFEQLIAEGYLEGRVGSGTYVASVLPEEILQVNRSNPSATFSAPSHRSPRHLSTWGASLAKREISLITRGETVRAFAPAIPALDEFPYKLWSRLAAHSWRVVKREQLTYSELLGYRPLREAIASYLRAARGVTCEPEQVIIMTGMHQTLALVCKMLLDPGERIYIEDPGPLVVRQILTDAGAMIVPLAVDEHGLSVKQLANAEKGGQDARLVYVTPSHQYPLGVTMSLSRRLALLQWAVRTGGWILEDDYDSEYRYEERPLASLQGLDQTGCVLYMGTFSKVLFPALRLSYLVVPTASVDLFTRGWATLGRKPPVMEQVVLTEFFNEGHFARHLRRMKGIYQERQAALIDAAQRELAGELEIRHTSTGLHVMGWLLPGVNDQQVWELALAQGIDTPPLSAHAMNQQPRGGLVLGYACVSPPEIRRGVDRLAMAFNILRREKRC